MLTGGASRRTVSPIRMDSMATTRDYLGYLTDKIDIAPANSQEELQAAEVIQGLMEEHGLETQIQEFDAPSAPALPYYVLMVLLTLAVFVAGLQSGIPSIVGIIVAVLCVVLLALWYLGSNLLGSMGSRARSQNVIGVHRAEGPLVTKGNRPIVIVAHYDTPRESFLSASPLARILPLLRRIAPVFLGIACFATVFQALAFVPGAARRVVWVIGLVSVLPLLALGIEAIYMRFSPCTDGANDNKSGVAAMLGVMAKVRPEKDAAEGYGKMLVMAPKPQEDEYEDDEYDEYDEYGEDDEYGYWETEDDDELGGTAARKPLVVNESGASAAVPSFMKNPEKKPEPTPQVVTEVYEEVEGVRHGADVLSSLRILPTSCEVVYDEPQMVSRTVRPQEPTEMPSREDRFDVLSGNGVESADRPSAFRRRKRTSEDEAGVAAGSGPKALCGV